MTGKASDRIIIESEKVGQHVREGEIGVEVSGVAPRD